ncbi:MAG: tetratricopeptide repeat protein [Thermodesulfobacteriota bacterium]|nr:MAG: tetratricopeptide repeat protein [Thermodesulfobacteriota bacterium]
MNGRLSSIVLLVLLSAALSACGASLAKKKAQADIHYRLGEVHLMERNIADALKELTKAVDLQPDNAHYRNALGYAYFVRGMGKEAHKAFDKAISLDPALSDAHLNKSALYLEEGEWDRAIAAAGKAAENIFYKSPEFAYNNMGWAYYNKRDYRGAVEYFSKALQANPGFALAHYNMGLAYEKAERLKEAVEAYRAAVNAAPNFLDAHFNLGMALAKYKDKAGAVKAFDRVIELAPESDKAQSAREYINLIK